MLCVDTDVQGPSVSSQCPSLEWGAHGVRSHGVLAEVPLTVGAADLQSPLTVIALIPTCVIGIGQLGH